MFLENCSIIVTCHNAIVNIIIAHFGLLLKNTDYYIVKLGTQGTVLCVSFFGRENFRDYINRQIRNKNLVRMKNKNNAYSEGGVPLTPAYESIVLNDSITDNEPTVNSNYMQEGEKRTRETVLFAYL